LSNVILLEHGMLQYFNVVNSDPHNTDFIFHRIRIWSE